jgi:hypothetical protein
MELTRISDLQDDAEPDNNFLIPWLKQVEVLEAERTSKTTSRIVYRFPVLKEYLNPTRGFHGGAIAVSPYAVDGRERKAPPCALSTDRAIFLVLRLYSTYAPVGCCSSSAMMAFGPLWAPPDLSIAHTSSRHLKAK